MNVSKAPVFVLGRQHSGNTLLAHIIGQVPAFLRLRGERNFFEQLPQIELLSATEKVDRVVALIEGEVDSGLKAEIQSDLRPKLEERARQQSVPAAALYSQGIDWLARSQERTRWVQKATSYVFYAEDIINAIPEAKLIFIVRNPLDIAASLKRRREWRRVLRMVWGWNKGLRIAQQCVKDYPENFVVLRYEDLTREPERELRHIFRFAGIPFSTEFLQVSHVNRSETAYNMESTNTGVNASRVFYYRRVLTAVEETIVRQSASGDLISQYYPDLPAPRHSGRLEQIPMTVNCFFQSFVTLLNDHAHLTSSPRQAWDRVRRRVL